MCGIAGFLQRSQALPPDEAQRLAVSMATAMYHRGPDDGGVWLDPENACCLSQRRLSIIDLSPAGHQPMESSCGRYVITFNGEIYNYLDVRSDLESHGVQFRTKTDTEVLIEALKFYGDAAFSRLDGMYAFALYDRKERELLLARDPFGEKPLYYTDQGGCFAFSSELHALTLIPNFDATISEESIAEYLAFQYVPAPNTIYRAVSKLRPGHFLRLRLHGAPRIGRHFRFAPHSSPVQRPMGELAEELESILLTSLRRRLIADVPLGAFLSGGVDSSTVVALVTKKLGRELKTFSIGFEGTQESEHILAREMAAITGSQHFEKVLSADVLELATKIGRVLDEPNGDSSCLPTYLLSQFTREHVTVAISGDGGDEMFGGYGRYFSTLAESERKESGDHSFQGWMAGRAYFSSRMLIFSDGELRDLFGQIPARADTTLAALRARVDSSVKPLLSRLREIDTENYMPGAVLPKVDRMSMQHALEVRTPFLSREVARFAERLHPDACYSNWQGKLVLKDIACKFIPRRIIERPKMGFGLPTNIWGREVMLGALRELVFSEDAKLKNWVPMAGLNRFRQRQEHPDSFALYQTWCLVLLEIWLRNHPVRRAEHGSADGIRVHRGTRPETLASAVQ
ncbi:MAG: asparagine synthase (glutamine-hydrolyzing) [Deltaproteobacteria bacterium]|nr:asparagine synthase (glutamine-hydrolyzing) [Deltaproteobacteria bacterium]